MNNYDPGDVVTLTVRFEVAGVLTDPSTVTLTVQDPAGEQAVYTYGGEDSPVVQDETGVYHADLSPLAVGVWLYKWAGTGGAAAVEEGSFAVTASALVPAAPGTYPDIYALVRHFRGVDAAALAASSLESDAAILVTTLLARYGKYSCLAPAYADIPVASKPFFDRAVAYLLTDRLQRYDSYSIASTDGTGALKRVQQGEVTLEYDTASSSATMTKGSPGGAREDAWIALCWLGCIPEWDRDVCLFGPAPPSRKMQVLQPTRGDVSCCPPRHPGYDCYPRRRR